MDNLKPSNSHCSKLCPDETPVVRIIRQLPPAHCNLKVDSFSLLQETLDKTKNNKFESIEFVAGGYTWVFSVYPKGKNEDNGEGHVSLYIRVVEKLNAGNFVSAIIRFLVYDQIQDNYLVIQDSKERRFHALKTEWGMPRALELSTFHDTSKGFLMNDCCIWGAEVFVVKGDNSIATLSMVKSLTIRNFTWRVTELTKEWLSSPTFNIEGRPWHLSLWPRGAGSQKGKSLSMFLWLDDVSDLTAGRKLYVEYEMCIKNQFEREDHKKTDGTWYSTGTKGWGHRDLLPLTELDNPSKGFKVNEVVIVEVNINVIFLLKDP